MKPVPVNAFAKLIGLSHADQKLVKGVAIDSRKVVSGDLFFALPGLRTDGHDFLKEAAERGAVCAVVKEGYRGDSYGMSLLPVPDVLCALQELAQKSLGTRKSKVIGITGSLGKTTVKEFTAALLRTRYKVFSSPLSYNSQATVPLSVLMAEEDEDYLILEMGMTHKGQLANLVKIAPPDIAMLTTVAAQHTINFPEGLAGISREKAAIFSHPKTQMGFLSHETYLFDEIYQTGNCPKIIFSTTCEEADYYLEPMEEGVKIYEKGRDCPFELRIDLPNKVHFHNFLAAVALARAAEVPWPLIQDVARFIRLPGMRFEKVVKQGIVFINDAYNANPDSMKAALESLPKPDQGGKTIAVLSEMDALGMYTEGGHALVAETALLYVDLLLCVGELCETMHKIWKREKKPVEWYETREELEKAVQKYAKPGDVVLLKGARSHGLDQILSQF